MSLVARQVVTVVHMYYSDFNIYLNSHPPNASFTADPSQPSEILSIIPVRSSKYLFKLKKFFFVRKSEITGVEMETPNFTYWQDYQQSETI